MRVPVRERRKLVLAARTVIAFTMASPAAPQQGPQPGVAVTKVATTASEAFEAPASLVAATSMMPVGERRKLVVPLALLSLSPWRPIECHSRAHSAKKPLIRWS